jgi:hypothetical protein
LTTSKQLYTTPSSHAARRDLHVILKIDKLVDAEQILQQRTLGALSPDLWECWREAKRISTIATNQD